MQANLTGRLGQLPTNIGMPALRSSLQTVGWGRESSAAAVQNYLGDARAYAW